jgi:hypothetical protein
MIRDTACSHNQKISNFVIFNTLNIHALHALKDDADILHGNTIIFTKVHRGRMSTAVMGSRDIIQQSNNKKA